MDIFELAFAKKLGGGSGSGGVTINNQDITVTENGTYTAENGYTGLGTVTVDVPTGGGESKISEIISGTVTEMREEDFAGATKIADHTFYKRTNLTSVAIPDSVTTIGDSSFSGCTGLISVTIGSGVTKINSSAFSSCKKLTSIIIPNSVTEIGSQVFNSCTGLTSIVIPDSVTTLSGYAFQGCSNLISVTIGSGVTRINGGTFSGCSAMQFYDFTSHTSVPTLASTSGLSVPSGCQIRIPASLYDEWIAATNWSTIASNIVAV